MRRLREYAPTDDGDPEAEVAFEPPLLEGDDPGDE
jgi:hypothetical protein